MPIPRRLAPPRAALHRMMPLCTAALAVLPLVGCAGEGQLGFSSEPMRSLAGLSGTGWQVLPLGRFVTRDSVRADVIEVCRPDRCGFSAVVARVTVRDAEAAALAASSDNAGQLAALVKHDDPDRRPPRVREGKVAASSKAIVPAKPVHVAGEPLRFGGWTGASLAITGGPHDRSAYGAVLQRPGPNGVDAVIAVSDRLDVAITVAESASAATVVGGD